MKKLFLVLFLICLSSPFLHAQTGGDEPVIIIIGGEGGGNNGGNGSGPILYAPARVPIQAAFYPSSSMLLVNFMYDLGMVAIEIENLITGESIQSNINAVQGVHHFSLPNVAGDHVITFMLPNGRVYRGVFETGQ